MNMGYRGDWRSCVWNTVDPHISEGNGTDPTSYMLKIRI